MLKLYDTPLAPNPRRVRWIMAEKGITDIEIVPINLLAGEHRDKAFRSKTGAPLLPALELADGSCIAESSAIGRYLESLYREPNLFGVDALEIAQIEMWSRRMELYLANPIMLSVRLTHPALVALETPNEAVRDYNRSLGERYLKVLNRRLDGREFIGADRLTYADIVAYIGLDFGRLIKWHPDESLTHVHRWMAAMKARPASKAGLQLVNEDN